MPYVAAVDLPANSVGAVRIAIRRKPDESAFSGILLGSLILISFMLLAWAFLEGNRMYREYPTDEKSQKEPDTSNGAGFRLNEGANGSALSHCSIRAGLLC